MIGALPLLFDAEILCAIIKTQKNLQFKHHKRKHNKI